MALKCSYSQLGEVCRSVVTKRTGPNPRALSSIPASRWDIRSRRGNSEDSDLLSGIFKSSSSGLCEMCIFPSFPSWFRKYLEVRLRPSLTDYKPGHPFISLWPFMWKLSVSLQDLSVLHQPSSELEPGVESHPLNSNCTPGCERDQMRFIWQYLGGMKFERNSLLISLSPDRKPRWSPITTDASTHLCSHFGKQHSSLR